MPDESREPGSEVNAGRTEECTDSMGYRYRKLYVNAQPGPTPDFGQRYVMISCIAPETPDERLFRLRSEYQDAWVKCVTTDDGDDVIWTTGEEQTDVIEVAIEKALWDLSIEVPLDGLERQLARGVAITHICRDYVE